MSGLKFTLFNVTSFLPDNPSGLKNIIFEPGFGALWVKGINYEKKYHTVYAATEKS